MAKFHFVIVVLLVVFAVSGCSAKRQKVKSARLTQANRQSTHQEVEAPVTPYPSADELKPDVPFADETGPETNSNDVFGSPEVPVVSNSPDEVYGPPEIDFALPADVALARQKVRYARLIQARRQAAYRQARLAKLAKLRSAKGRTA